MLKVLQLILVNLCVLVCIAPLCGAAPFFTESYEDLEIGAVNWIDPLNITTWKANPGSENKYYEVVGSPVRAGSNSMKVYNYYIEGSSSYRMEHILREYPGSGAYEFEIGEEYWIGFSIYLPADYVCDGCDVYVYNDELHMQLKGLQDVGESTVLGPAMCLLIEEDQWVVRIRSDADEMTVKTDYDRNTRTEIGSWLGDKGTWTDWVVNIKLDYTKNGDNGGFVDVYKNKILVFQDTGGNCFNDDIGPFFSYGTYKFPWITAPSDVDTRIIYLDEAKFGDSTSSLNEVSPSEEIVATGTITTQIQGDPIESSIANDQLTIILTISDTTLNAFDNTIRAAIVAGMESDQDEATGWNALIRDDPGPWSDDVDAVVRTDANTCTIKLPLSILYSITRNETITITFPATATASGEPIISSNTITISNELEEAPVSSGAGMVPDANGMAVTPDPNGVEIIP